MHVCMSYTYLYHLDVNHLVYAAFNCIEAAKLGAVSWAVTPSVSCQDKFPIHARQTLQQLGLDGLPICDDGWLQVFPLMRVERCLTMVGYVHRVQETKGLGQQ